MKPQNIKKNAKGTSLTLLAVLLGFIGAHAAANALPQNKITFPALTGVSAIAHMAADNVHLKNVLLGMGLYSSVKSLNQLKPAVDAVQGLDGVKDMIARFIPNLGSADFGNGLSSLELAQIEDELLGLGNYVDMDTQVPLVNGVGNITNLL